jgi:CheY-like chemotaxis protein
MVVEDEPDIYDVLLAMFELWGIEGVAFVDGAEAISWIDAVDQGRVHGELPELAILDIRLPEASGPEVGSRLRKSPILKNVAIVLITAYRLSPEDERESVAQAEADRLMYKPLPGMPELRKILDEVVGKRQELAAKEEREKSNNKSDSKDEKAKQEKKSPPVVKE